VNKREDAQDGAHARVFILSKRSVRSRDSRRTPGRRLAARQFPSVRSVWETVVSIALSQIQRLYLALTMFLNHFG
jgi:hypothetical protein